MFYIDVFDNTTGITWQEEFDSYYLFRKRYYRLKYSKKLKILSHSNLER